jgi:Rieske Fe-S protein
MTLDPQNPMTRRRILGGVVVAGAAAPILAACGTGEPTPEDSPSAEETTGSGGGEAVARTADVPVGGGTVNKEAHIVVVQPTAGEFKAFTSICTHRGCDVGTVTGGTINCECHGSKFKIADGSVSAGPATSPLPAAQVSVQGGNVVQA